MARARGATQTYFALGASEPQQRSVHREYEHGDRALQLFDEAMKLVEQARATGSKELVEEAERHAWRIVREEDPVRLSYVAAVLGVTDQTVRDWLDAGLLEDFGGAPRRVGLESVARVRELVRDLRSSGQQRDLMTAVLRALELDELRRDDRFLTSLDQMRRGERA
jgi:DNA-binding transcriptional regulator YiaG